jgi:hypothetical protein
MQLGEASADEAFKIRYFPLSLTGQAFTWFTSLPAHSICSWKDLEQKFHAYYYTGSNEKTLIDLTTLRQRNNETPMEFLRRFKETKNMCFSLNIPDDQLAGMAVAGMLPAIRDEIRRPWPAVTPIVIDEQSSIWLQERLQICQAQ